MSEALPAVIDILARAVKCDPATLDAATGLHTLGLQSIDVLQIIFDLESRLGVTIPDAVASELGGRTIGELAALLDGLQQEPR